MLKPNIVIVLVTIAQALIGVHIAQAESSSVIIDGVAFGATADERGPIGGGVGYTAIVREGDHVATDAESLLQALTNAKAGEVVFLPGDAVIDMTTLVHIEKASFEVPAGVTLASDRGHKGSLGALICSHTPATAKLIVAAGPGVRITGLRLQGPTAGRHLDHHRRSYGPDGRGRDYYYKFPTSNGVVTEADQLEVDNCEITAFSHAGVHLRGGVGHRVHHNSIHHCQYQGLGYGVCLNVASAHIEHNLFNWNRHSIAGTGRPGCSYVARNNIEQGESLSHCFDMHGGRDRKDGTNIAGTSIEISHNTFLAPQLPIKIRGVPEQQCLVHHNWFPNHDEPSAAVKAEDRTVVAENAHGRNPAVVSSK